MTRPDLERLLGGYAAGTLTAEERRVLFDAALADQTLFDALADEEALREVLADPACRARVQSALVEPPRRIWLRPAVWALAATVAAAIVLTVAVVRTRPARVMAPAPQQIAMAKKPTLPGPATAAIAERPVPANRKPAVTEVRPAPRAFTPPATLTAAQPAFAPQASTAANAPATALAAPHKELAAAPPARTAALDVRLRPSAPAAAGGMVASRAIVAPQAAPAPPPPPASKRDAGARLQSEAVETARNSPAVVGRDAAELQNTESAPAQPANEVKAKIEPAFGLRYTLFRRGAEVPPDTAFSPAESARVRIEADQGGYLYVLVGKRALFAGSVLANQPVVVEAKPGVLHLVLFPEPDSGSLSTLVSRTRQQFSGANLQVQSQTAQRRGDQSVSVQNSSPPPQTGVLADVSINAR